MIPSFIGRGSISKRVRSDKQVENPLIVLYCLHSIGIDKRSTMSSVPKSYLLGIEAGGTRSTVLSADPTLQVISKKLFGAANLRLLTEAALTAFLREVAIEFP